MYSLFCKNNQHLIISTRVIRASIRFKTQFGVCEKSKLLVRLFSSSTLKDEQFFTVSYLANSCGFSLEDAKSVSTKVKLRNFEKPDSVLLLLRSYGFINTHITKVVKQYPKVLLAKPEKTLKPKMEFLNSIGISSDALVEFVSRSPLVLRSSLQNRLIPFYKFLKNILHSDGKVIKAYICCVGRFSGDNVQKNFASNIEYLKRLGVPESSIFYMLKSATSVVFRGRHVFEKIVKEVCSMGYDPKKVQFIQAMSVFFCMSNSTREHKMEMYKRWGWSEIELDFALKNYPILFSFSEKNISKTLDFLVNQMGYNYTIAARSPTLLCYSLEKRIIPRCMVYKVLLLKGLFVNRASLVTLMQCSADHFVKKFVIRYIKDVPQLMKIYQGKMSLLELGFTSEDVYRVKPWQLQKNFR